VKEGDTKSKEEEEKRTQGAAGRLTTEGGHNSHWREHPRSTSQKEGEEKLVNGAHLIADSGLRLIAEESHDGARRIELSHNQVQVVDQLVESNRRSWRVSPGPAQRINNANSRKAKKEGSRRTVSLTADPPMIRWRKSCTEKTGVNALLKEDLADAINSKRGKKKRSPKKNKSDKYSPIVFSVYKHRLNIEKKKKKSFLRSNEY
jgi:hypothetical protein